MNAKITLAAFSQRYIDIKAFTNTLKPFGIDVKSNLYLGEYVEDAFCAYFVIRQKDYGQSYLVMVSEYMESSWDELLVRAEEQLLALRVTAVNQLKTVDGKEYAKTDGLQILAGEIVTHPDLVEAIEQLHA